MKRLLGLMVVGTLVAAGCGSTPEKKVDVRLMKSDPPADCRMVADVQTEGDDMNEAKANLRLAAAEKGGNYVRLDALSHAGGDAVAAGAAFQCPSPTTAPKSEVKKE